MKSALRRSNNRNDMLLDAAAELFATQGFRNTTMRDIAKKSGMLPGSIYYHYPSKEDLLLAVYESGVAQIVEALETAIAQAEDPWERLGLAISTHIEAITRDSHYMRVINRVLPEQVPNHRDMLTDLRGKYERCLQALIEDLPVAPSVDRKLLRLMVLGAVNHTQFWFDSAGALTPAEVGQAFTRFLIEPVGSDQATARSSRKEGSHAS